MNDFTCEILGGFPSNPVKMIVIQSDMIRHEFLMNCFPRILRFVLNKSCTGGPNAVKL